MDATSTANLPFASIVDELIGNAGGNSARITIERLVSLIAALMGPTYATRAQLYADLNWPAGAVGYVREDSNTAFNGVYKKAGASGSGSWSRVGNLPTGAVELALIDAVNSFGVRFYNTRSEATSNAASLPSGVQRIFLLESWGVSVRARNSTDDALFGAVPYWGISRRLITVEEVQAAILTETNARVASSDQFRDALRAGAQIPLTSVSYNSGANSYSAAIDGRISAVSITSVPDGGELYFVPTAANNGQNPQVVVGLDTGRSVRRSDGTAWPAGGFAVGRPFVLRRAGSQLLVVRGEITHLDLTAEATARTAAIAAETTARSDADILQRVATRQGGITLVNVTLTGNAYTADIEPALAAIGMTDIPTNGEFTVIFPATNPSGNPSLNGRTIRRANGSSWPALKTLPGRPYTLKRVGNELRVLSGDVQAEEVDAQFSALTRKVVIVTEASPSADKNANNQVLTPGSYRFLDIAIGNAPPALTSPHSAEVQVETSATGVWQTWRDASGRQFVRRRIDGVWQAWIELARESRVATLETEVAGKAQQSDMAAAGLTIGQLLASVASIRSTRYAVVKQTTPDMPGRVDEPKVHWFVYSPPPRELMGADDIYTLMDTPQPPLMPEGELQVFDARYGNQMVLRVGAIPPLNPPISAIEYSIDNDAGDAFLPLPGIAPGDYLVTAPNGNRQIRLRYRNTFNDVSVETPAIPVTISANNIFPVMTGTGRLHVYDNINWRYLSTDQAPATRGLILDGTGFVQASHINARLRYGHNAFYVTEQRIRIAQVYVHPSSAGAFGIILGLNTSQDGTSAIEVIITATGANVYRRTQATGAGTLLASFTAEWVWPLATFEVVRNGNNIEIRASGHPVITYTLPEAHRLTGGTPSIGIMYPNISGGDLTMTRYRPDRLGHL